MDKAELHELIDAKYRLQDFLDVRAPEIAKKLSGVDEWYYYKWMGFSLTYRVVMHDMSLEQYSNDEENWEPCVECCTEDREGEDVDDNLQMVEIHKRDSWNEPTDGTVLMDVDTINRNIINKNFDPSYMAFVRKHYRALKGFSKILGV